ncbi:MAG: ribosomal L7Ae/L30e/S12e/Gadd45 family protein [Clostridiaceae bacterium]|nr:ribosomal L7Ae/L30e/S12e/Gadd45 family protein [Clostridiaceae bacterium]
MLNDLQEKEKVIGIKQTIKALNQQKVTTLYIAEDADQQLLENAKVIARESGVEIVSVDTMKKLGKACGIDVSAAAAAVLK